MKVTCQLFKSPALEMHAAFPPSDVLCQSTAARPLRSAHGTCLALTECLTAVVMQVLSISPADLGNLWFLGPNPGVATFASRYNILVQLAYVPAFPLTILARTVATSAIALLCCRHPGTHGKCCCMSQPA